MTKVGRPKSPEDKARAPGISVRLTKGESNLISDYLTKCGIRSKSDWARKSLLYVVSNDIHMT